MDRKLSVLLTEVPCLAANKGQVRWYSSQIRGGRANMRARCFDEDPLLLSADHVGYWVQRLILSLQEISPSERDHTWKKGVFSLTYVCAVLDKTEDVMVWLDFRTLFLITCKKHAPVDQRIVWNALKISSNSFSFNFLIHHSYRLYTFSSLRLNMSPASGQI